MSITLVNAILFEMEASSPIEMENAYVRYNTRTVHTPRPSIEEYEMYADFGSRTIVLDTWASVWEFRKEHLPSFLSGWCGTLVVDGVTVFDDTTSNKSYLWKPVDGSTITFSTYDIGGYSALKMEVVTSGGGSMLDVEKKNSSNGRIANVPF